MIALLETPRLRLRPFTPADLPDLHRLDSDPTVMRYVIPPRSYAETEEYLQKILKNYEDPHGPVRWCMVEKETGAMAGVIGIFRLEDDTDWEIGYRFFENFWGKGYATEALREVIDYGLHIRKLPRLVAVANPENRASYRVMEKVGMHFEKMAFYYGTDVVFYAIYPNPHAALIEELERYLRRIRDIAPELPMAHTWRQGGPNTAQILFHMAEASDFWVRQLILGHDRPRDRAQEFVGDFSPEHIQESLEKALDACRLFRQTPVELTTPVAVVGTHNPSETFTHWTVAKALTHVTAHAAEHFGQLKAVMPRRV
jgi:ribosomal-protein-alanine N-acetyltransferase